MSTKLRQSRTTRRHPPRRSFSGRSARPTWAIEPLEDRCLLSGPGPVGYEPFASEQELQGYLIDQAVLRWQYSLGYPAGPWTEIRNWGNRLGSISGIVTAFSSGNDYSATNIQVAGVDEADFVKTDGDYAYIVSGETLAIVDVWPAEAVEVVARYELPGRAFAEYLTGDRLTVIASNDDGISWDEPTDPDAPWDYSGLQVLVFDVSDPTSPVVLETTALTTSYVGSRMVGNNLYLLTQSDVNLPAPEVLIGEAGDEAYETEAQYRERLWSLDVNDWLPQMVTRTYDGERAHDVFAAIHAADQIHGRADNLDSLLSVVVFNVADEIGGPVDSAATPADRNAIIYASTDNLYVAQGDSSWWSSRENTNIVKFHMSADDVSLVAAGTIPGRVLNQFSIDEHAGYLRVATSAVRDGWRQNNVYVLAESPGGRLDIVGRVENLAPGERIYAVRFLGDRGYVVTFVQYDPLFVLDLSDPGIPQVVGELTLPGFSNYLQPIGGDRLIGIGLNAGPFWSPWDDDVLVSLFDVSDPEQPALLDQYDFPQPPFGDSEARMDHHAVGYYPEHNLLAMPFREGWVESNHTPSSLQLLRIDSASIEPVASITWNESVRRTFRIENVLYVVGGRKLEAYRMDDFSTPLSAVQFADLDAIGFPNTGSIRNIRPGTVVTTPIIWNPQPPILPDVIASGAVTPQPLRWEPIIGSSSHLHASERSAFNFAGIGVSLAITEGTTRLTVGTTSASAANSAPSIVESTSSSRDFLDRSLVDSVFSRPRRAGSGGEQTADAGESAMEAEDAAGASEDAALDPLFGAWAESLTDHFDFLFDAYWATTGDEAP